MCKRGLCRPPNAVNVRCNLAGVFQGAATCCFISARKLEKVAHYVFVLATKKSCALGCNGDCCVFGMKNGMFHLGCALSLAISTNFNITDSKKEMKRVVVMVKTRQ